MKNLKKNLLRGTLLVGAMASTSAITVNANDALSFKNLGEGAEVRSVLSVEKSNAIGLAELNCGGKSSDAKCGEGKCGDTKKTEESKTSDAKCGEGKCGDVKESKSADAKCGEGKCGDKKSKKDKKDAEAKSTEHKCGEGKCG